MATQPASGTSRAKLVGDGDTFEVNGRKFKLTIHPEEGMGPPWEENDCHGIVSEWVYREAHEGERLLNSDRSAKRYYDIAATLDIARTKWGFTDEEAAAKAVEADFQRMYGWCNDQWYWVCLQVTMLDGVNAGASETLGGVESDCREYISEEAYELADQLLTAADHSPATRLVRTLRQFPEHLTGAEDFNSSEGLIEAAITVLNRIHEENADE